jgi:hypothetical protein
LLLDEMKLSASLVWNSRDQSLSGFANNHEDLVSLQDLYVFVSTLDKTPTGKATVTETGDNPRHLKRSQYVLQFLWRDMTSDFDLIGPYYTSTDGLNAEWTYHCMWETIRTLNRFGFQTDLVVLDAATTNMAMIEMCCGEANMDYASMQVQPACFNPTTGRDMYFIVDPSHQYKNMRYA